MLPIRDTIPAKRFPVVNYLIIGINIIVYLIQMQLGPELERFVYVYGLVPARYSLPEISAYFSTGQQLFALLSFMFLHGGFLHLLGNMWTLYIFGDNVEDHLGHFRYLLFYLLCGLASGFSHLFLNLQSNVPTIGASGAIAGVMGAYFILYPRSRILTLIPIFFIPWFIEISAFFFLALWFLLQFVNATLRGGGAGGIAWWAHIGGFVFGIVFLKIFQLLPSTGVTEKLGPVTTKKKSHRLQVIHPAASTESLDLRGSIRVTPHEARFGSNKLINIPWGFQKRLFKVVVPAGIREGQMLRLKGMGRQHTDGRRGDLFLTVVIH